MAAVARFLFSHGANILHADQRQDNDVGLFFMRVEALAKLQREHKLQERIDAM